LQRIGDKGPQVIQTGAAMILGSDLRQRDEPFELFRLGHLRTSILIL
jgi:hypothetical protein